MEPRFGHDFSNVRVHTNAQASASAKRIGALAFTAGRDIVFGSGQFAPETVAGQRLLAHELTHVIQQEGSASRGVQRDVDPAVEEEVERAGQDFRRERRRDLSQMIDRMRFRKIVVDCPATGGVRLLDVLSRMRSRVNANQACLRFFQQNFRLSPDRFFLPNSNPTITVDATLPVSGRTRCPEPAVLIQSALCGSPHRERVIMHELTHYAGCLIPANRPSSEELAEQGANVCMGTVQEALEAARRQGRVAPTAAPPPQPPQHKLIHDQPGDQYEQEADRVAEQVMNMRAPFRHQEAGSAKSPSSVVQRKCADCEDNEELIQKKESAGQPSAADQARDAPQMVHETLRSPGRPLDRTTQHFMKERFGRDFSQVRVHADRKAAESARAVQARAYTLGSDIVFGAGEYEPATIAGQRLLAHELTHVIRQSSGVASGELIQRQPLPDEERNKPTTIRSGPLKGSTFQIEKPPPIERCKRTVTLKKGEPLNEDDRRCLKDQGWTDQQMFSLSLEQENDRTQQFFDSEGGLPIYALHEQVHRAMRFRDDVLLTVLKRVAVNNITLVTTINHYQDAGYGDLLEDVRARLYGAKLEEAMRILHGGTPQFGCVPGEHEMILEAKSIAMSMAKKAAKLIDEDLRAGVITVPIRVAFNSHFNPGGAPHSLNFRALRRIRNVLLSALGNMFQLVAFKCMKLGDAQYSECDKAAAFTYFQSKSTVYICPNFWRWDKYDKAAGIIHEFVHHFHKNDDPKRESIRDRAYEGKDEYSKLTPQTKGSASDSLSNADSYANFARDLW